MSVITDVKADASLRTQVGGTDHAQHLLRLYEITAEDLECIRAFGLLVVPRIHEYVQGFYSWLETQRSGEASEVTEPATGGIGNPESRRDSAADTR